MNLIPSPQSLNLSRLYLQLQSFAEEHDVEKEERRLASEALSDVGVVKGAETKRNERESLRGVINRTRKQRKV